MFRKRFYGKSVVDCEPRGRAQVDDVLQGSRSIQMSEPILRLAQAEYDRQHPGQPYLRMQARGGLSVLEVVALLADYVERLGGKPAE